MRTWQRHMLWWQTDWNRKNCEIKLCDNTIKETSDWAISTVLSVGAVIWCCQLYWTKDLLHDHTAVIEFFNLLNVYRDHFTLALTTSVPSARFSECLNWNWPDSYLPMGTWITLQRFFFLSILFISLTVKLSIFWTYLEIVFKIKIQTWKNDSRCYKESTFSFNESEQKLVSNSY